MDHRGGGLHRSGADTRVAAIDPSGKAQRTRVQLVEAEYFMKSRRVLYRSPFEIVHQSSLLEGIRDFGAYVQRALAVVRWVQRGAIGFVRDKPYSA